MNPFRQWPWLCTVLPSSDLDVKMSSAAKRMALPQASLPHFKPWSWRLLPAPSREQDNAQPWSGSGPKGLLQDEVCGVSRGMAGLCRSEGPEVCGECEWYAWVDSFRARRRDGSPAICCEPRRPIATAPQEWRCCFFFLFPLKKFFLALFPAPAYAYSWISGKGAGIPATEWCVLKEKRVF